MKGRRATDISLVRDKKKKRKDKKIDKPYLPAFLRKPKADSTDFPISIDYRPELSEIKQGKAGRYDQMAEIIAASYQGTRKKKIEIPKPY